MTKILSKKIGKTNSNLTQDFAKVNIIEKLYDDQKRSIIDSDNKLVLNRLNYLVYSRERKRHKRQLHDKKFGFLSIKCSKRNIYLNLSDSRNRLRATMSTGYIKVKGKARKALYVIKKLAKTFSKHILASKLKRIHLSISGYIPRKVKRTILRIFKSMSFSKAYKKKGPKLKKKNKKRFNRLFKIYRYTKYLRYPHNGCRPSKVRRK